ncbi:acyltransferase domain-containing protein, partial [Streptomyces sp. NPDC098085]|uniref:acyltransferase domain-containing protein n=1 Tax=Streptomyces sp. NPDC098085 TaxID=3366094 RepID=UPI0038111218
IEVEALSRVFGGVGLCGLGSVKGNVGHLDAAAGMAGLFKVVLALGHEVIPPTVNHGVPGAGLEGSGFRVPVEPVVWPRRVGRVRRAGVSAFGFGGTNAHVVVEEAPVVGASGVSGRPGEVLVVSACTAEALERATDDLAAHLRGHRPVLADVAYTLACGRRDEPFRRSVMGGDVEVVAGALEARDPARTTTSHVVHQDVPLVFQYGGQGTQCAGMSRDLYEHHRVFREAVDRCVELLVPELGMGIRDVLLSEDSVVDVGETRWAQPALVVHHYALTELWRSWGVVPSAVVGHSLGEWSAACAAGVVSLPDLLRLVVLRGRLMQDQPAGAMLSVMCDRAALEAHLPEDLSLAAHNG